MAAAVLPRIRSCACRRPRPCRPRPGERQHTDHAGDQPPSSRIRHDADCLPRSSCSPARPCSSPHSVSLQTTNTGTTCGRYWSSTSPRLRPVSSARRQWTSIRKRYGASPCSRALKARAMGPSCPGATRGTFGAGLQFTVDGGIKAADGEENPRARFPHRLASFFAVLGVPILEGRDFTDEDRAGSELVSIISQSVAQRLFPNGEAVNRRLWWLDPSARQTGAAAHRRRGGRRRRRGVMGGPALTVYQARATDGCRRPAVRARGRRSVYAGAGGDAHDPRAFPRSARGARRDAGGRARRCCRPNA